MNVERIVQLADRLCEENPNLHHQTAILLITLMHPPTHVYIPSPESMELRRQIVADFLRLIAEYKP